MIEKKIKLTFLSNTMTQPLNRYLNGFECEHLNIDTVAQTLSAKLKTDYLILLLDTSYYAQDGFLNTESCLRAEKLEALLHLFRSNNTTKVIVSNITGNFLNINSGLYQQQCQKLFEINQKIERFSTISDVAILNVHKLTNDLGQQNFYNRKNGFLFQTPWTQAALAAIANAVCEIIQLFNYTRKKVLVLDADNTLWGGIIGEDGIDNIDIDQNYPGIIYRFFQQQLKQLQKSGLLLTLASKNNEQNVKEVFNKKNMPLTWDDFVVKKVNWQPKAQNIEEIANTLNVGLESILFLDDNTFELSETEARLGIDTIKISVANPIENLNIFDNLISVKALNINNEDREKTAQYQKQNKRTVYQKQFISMEDYLRSIEMKITMFTNNTSQLKRITQLINKTNQFNLTTRRYDETEVSNMMGMHQVFSFSLNDKFGDLGIISVVIVKDNNIDTFLISCRALGRNIEQKILHLVTKHTSLPLRSCYIKTAKNEQVSCFYDKFASLSDKEESDSKNYQLVSTVKDVSYIQETA